MHACMHTHMYTQMGGMPHANSPHLAEWLCQLKESFLQTHDGTAHWWYWAGGDQGDNPAINTGIKGRKRMSITITQWILSTRGQPVLRTVKVGNNRARGNESWKQGDNPAINKRWGLEIINICSYQDSGSTMKGVGGRTQLQDGLWSCLSNCTSPALVVPNV